jgi:nucleoside-diphosphate-sugar epimerase
MSVAHYLVTGGAGFIGSNLVETLLRRGDDVAVLDDFSTGRHENLARAGQWATEGGGAFHLHEGDVRDAAACRAAVRGVDFVLHQAAVPSVPRSVAEPVFTNDVNVQGTLLLLEAARGAAIRRFVFASSSSIYGESEVLPKVETMPPAPISPYGLQKLTSETYCALYHRLYGLPTVALRYFNVFGPRQNPASEYAAVIPRFLAAAASGGRATVHGDGEQSRDFSYVENVVRANLLACEADAVCCGAAYNIAGGERVTLNELLRRIGAIVGREVPADHTEPRSGDIRHSLAGIERAAERLGFRPSVGLDEGLRRTLEAL